MMRNPNLWSVFSNSEKIFLKEDRFGGFKKNHSLAEKIELLSGYRVFFLKFVKIYIIISRIIEIQLESLT